MQCNWEAAGEHRYARAAAAAADTNAACHCTLGSKASGVIDLVQLIGCWWLFCVLLLVSLLLLLLLQQAHQPARLCSNCCC
jgi:hypothetical protein